MGPALLHLGVRQRQGRLPRRPLQQLGSLHLPLGVVVEVEDPRAPLPRAPRALDVRLSRREGGETHDDLALAHVQPLLQCRGARQQWHLPAAEGLQSLLALAVGHGPHASASPYLAANVVLQQVRQRMRQHCLLAEYDRPRPPLGAREGLLLDLPDQVQQLLGLVRDMREAREGAVTGEPVSSVAHRLPQVRDAVERALHALRLPARQHLHQILDVRLDLRCHALPEEVNEGHHAKLREDVNATADGTLRLLQWDATLCGKTYDGLHLVRHHPLHLRNHSRIVENAR
mmetsp:Transcript_89445/g.283088  ORF Transcript_89445/g.283088 Transcript_89445/m.283088 type:complete len:287 (-) Transcript_89445:636-1496(-)